MLLRTIFLCCGVPLIDHFLVSEPTVCLGGHSTKEAVIRDTRIFQADDILCRLFSEADASVEIEGKRHICRLLRHDEGTHFLCVFPKDFRPSVHII